MSNTLPAMQSGENISLLQVHNQSTEFAEELALKGFGEEIADHLFRGTTLNREISNVNAVGDEIETAIEVLGALAA